MSKTNVAVESATVFTHEGAVAQRVGPYAELRRTMLTCLLWENTFYESGDSIAARIAALVPQVDPDKVAALAVEARDRMQLRHAPLFLVRELARIKGTGALVTDTLAHIIQRADELAEFVSLYWRDKKQPLSAGVKHGLAAAFQKFDEYRLAKYDRTAKVKLRDVLFLCHAKPKDAEQGAFWKRLIAGTLESPDTWEVELSAGKDKKETWERLLREKKLGGLAVLRNLRNMQKVDVDNTLIRDRLAEGIKRALPFRFIVAAKYAPKLEEAIGEAMLLATRGLRGLPGTTLLLIDVSGSMNSAIGDKTDATRVEVAGGLAILAREICESPTIYATAGSDSKETHKTEELPARRGFALADSLKKSAGILGAGGIFMVQALDFISTKEKKQFDRVIVFTDEQDCDLKNPPASAAKLGKRNYVVNVASYAHGFSYGNGWQHIDGWSERILDYIAEVELENSNSSASLQ